MLYEMGLPVVELEAGDPWHINVCQRVPLTSDRDNVSPAFLRDVRAEVLNLMANRLTDDQAAESWVSEATEDDRIESEAVREVVKKRFGDKAVVADPNDPQSRERAIMAGYTIVPARAMSKDTWKHVRDAGAVPSSSQMFRSVGVDTETIPEDKWTDDMRILVEVTKRIAFTVWGIAVDVAFCKSVASTRADWTDSYPPVVTYNVQRLGKSWFRADNLNEHVKLIIHEIGHQRGGHLEASYIRALCEIGAELFKLDRRDVLGSINPHA
jgi:hypothetical protein